METHKTETETFNEVNDISDDDDTDDEQMIQKIEVKSILYNIKARIALCLSLALLLLVTTIAVGFYGHFADTTPQNGHHLTTQEFVEEITEDLLGCQKDINCHEFNMTADKLNKIRNAFNEYDGNNDNKWDKQTFIKYYGDISYQSEIFDTMDINNDTILSYKEMVLYLLNIKDQAIIQTILVPPFDNVITTVYNTNLTSKDQLYWEYVAELFFYSFDDTLEGHISKANYLDKIIDAEFDFFTFDEFIEWEFNNSAIQKSINTNLYNFNSTDFTKITIQDLHLQHTLYNDSIIIGDNSKQVFPWNKIRKCINDVNDAFISCLNFELDCILDVLKAIDICNKLYRKNNGTIP